MHATCATTRLAWCFLTILYVASTALGQVNLVRGGHVHAVVVTAVKPSPVAAYAADELVTHVEKATGLRLPVAIETAIPRGYATRVFIGVTDAAQTQGFDPEALEVEEYLLRTDGSDLYVLGKELPPAGAYTGPRPHGEPWNPLSGECVHSGTLFGVYELLERCLGVRWLWPGELGTYVPRARTVEIPDLNRSVKPRLLYRDLGGWNLRHIHLAGVMYDHKRPPFSGGFTRISEEILRNLIFPTKEAGHEYGMAMHVYLRRHRRVTPIEPVRVPRNTHFVAGIKDWWAEYGETHPEWFALVDGKRGDVGRAGAYTNLCVSNDELRDFIVNEAWGGGDVLNLGDADGRYCECEKCLSWDGPQPRLDDVPEMMRDKYTPHAMGARYARFWKDIYEKAVKRNPNVTTTGYLYHHTLPTPLTDIKLNRNILGEFVIYGGWDGWYPMSPEEDRWTREQWLGWGKTGMSLFYRPNYLLSLYATPNVTTRQAGEFFKLAYANGMIGAYFDAYSFSWAVHGPMAFMHYRLLWNPELEIEAIRQEYFSAFGPAAEHVRDYFDYWEEYARTRPSISEASSALEKLRRPRGHYLAYPPAVYRPARALLNAALEAAQNHPLPEFTERVRFLQAGLEHALLATRIHGLLDYEGPESEIGRAPLADPEKLKQARQAMRQLIAFRHDPKNRFVSAYIDNAMVERNFIRNIEALFEED